MSRLINLLIILSTVQSVWSFFSCNNKGYVCKAGTCNYFGNCTCQTGFQGYNCGLDSALITKDIDCTVKCLNKGICYETNKCYCTEDFTGPTCGDPMDMVHCKKQSMHITVYRPAGFVGEMFLKQSFVHCKLMEVLPSDRPGYKKFELNVKYKHTGHCQLDQSKNQTTEDEIYTADLVTADEKGSYGMTDSTKQMMCTYPAMKLGSFQDITADPNAQKPVITSFLDDNYEPIQQVDLGQQLHIVFRPADTTVYKGVAVTFLEVYSVDTATNTIRSEVLIDNECIQQEANERLQLSLSTENKEINGFFQFVVKIKAFRLVENAPLNYNYRVRFCRQLCQPPVNNPCDILPVLPAKAFVRQPNSIDIL